MAEAINQGLAGHPRTVVWIGVVLVWYAWVGGALTLPPAHPSWVILVTAGLVAVIVCSVLGLWVTGLRWVSWLAPLGDFRPALWRLWSTSDATGQEGFLIKLRTLHYVDRRHVKDASRILRMWRQTNTDLHLLCDPAMTCMCMWSDGPRLMILAKPAGGLHADLIKAKFKELGNEWELSVSADAVNDSQVVLTCLPLKKKTAIPRHADFGAR